MPINSHLQFNGRRPSQNAKRGISEIRRKTPAEAGARVFAKEWLSEPGRITKGDTVRHREYDLSGRCIVLPNSFHWQIAHAKEAPHGGGARFKIENSE